MDLYVIRHAIAEERRAGLPDAERRLTARGQDRFRRCVRALESLGVRLGRTLHSPWVRAARTAELLAPLCDEPLEVEPELARAPRRELLERLERLAGEAGGPVAVVGHEPWLGELTAWLCCGERGTGASGVRLKKGGVAHLRGEPRPAAMELRALLPPKVLCAIG